jgi:hypothetical protein
MNRNRRPSSRACPCRGGLVVFTLRRRERPAPPPYLGDRGGPSPTVFEVYWNSDIWDPGPLGEANPAEGPEPREAHTRQPHARIQRWPHRRVPGPSSISLRALRPASVIIMRANWTFRLPTLMIWQWAVARTSWTRSAKISTLNPWPSNVAPVQPRRPAAASVPLFRAEVTLSRQLRLALASHGPGRPANQQLD